MSGAFHKKFTSSSTIHLMYRFSLSLFFLSIRSVLFSILLFRLGISLLLAEWNFAKRMENFSYRIHSQKAKQKRCRRKEKRTMLYRNVNMQCYTKVHNQRKHVLRLQHPMNKDSISIGFINPKKSVYFGDLTIYIFFFLYFLALAFCFAELAYYSVFGRQTERISTLTTNKSNAMYKKIVCRLQHSYINWTGIFLLFLFYL